MWVDYEGCSHCFHQEYIQEPLKPDCKKSPIVNKLVEKCCKCGDIGKRIRVYGQ